MPEDTQKDFNQRLSQWVASQGLWFQIRYSAETENFGSHLLVQSFKLGVKLLVLVAIVLAVFWGYLYKRTESQQFSEQIRSVIQNGLSVSELALRHASYTGGQLVVSGIAAEGGDDTFFDSLEAFNLSSKMPLWDTFTGEWDPEVIRIGTLAINLRAGANDEASAAALGNVIFGSLDKISLTTIEVADASLDWGYSKTTEGGIQGSNLRIQRSQEGWRMDFTGGQFHQNWLRDLEIEKLVALCKPDGITFETATFKRGQTRVDLSGLQLTSGAQPVVTGKLRVEKMSLDRILPKASLAYLEGTFSGTFEVYGSTNISNGIGYKGTARLSDGDMISLHDEIALLEALSVMDYSRNYFRVDFTEGTFDIETHGGGVEITEIELKAMESGARTEPIVMLEGGFSARLPTKSEIQDAIGDGLFAGQKLPKGFDETEGIGSNLMSEQVGLSLRKAAMQEDETIQGMNADDDPALFARINLQQDIRQLQLKLAEQLSRIRRIKGNCVISLQADAFERAGELKTMHPVDVSTSRVRVQVPLNGQLEELTQRQAEVMFEKGRRP